MTEPDSRHYWVRISEHSGPDGYRDAFAGFLVTRKFVLTALHCLQALSSEDAPLNLQLPDQRVIPGHVCHTVTECDLALIAVDHAVAHDLPLPAETDWPRPNSPWQVTYCPPNEFTQLSGHVTHRPIHYTSSDEVAFTAFQLTVRELLKDYRGYSGSPVDTEPGRPVVGILIEQQLSRAGSGQATNVLFAASIEHAMDRFPHFSVDRLRREARGPRPPSSEVTAAATGDDHSPGRLSASAVKEWLEQVKQWEETGLITPADATEERRRTLQRLGERVLGGTNDGD